MDLTYTCDGPGGYLVGWRWRQREVEYEPHLHNPGPVQSSAAGRLRSPPYLHGTRPGPQREKNNERPAPADWVWRPRFGAAWNATQHRRPRRGGDIDCVTCADAPAD